ncbi:FAM63A-like isoform X2 [Chlorella sorokiniana]|uniref:FAM63A-like isoform X2 n=1 Tax=Chlorella sorokiniana TaxID=3076 RepID=A0A2P6TW77_CHLSO|nr:FAM63A-like isoform X2 [Chlorella sorokiniana]|eukprot:PRW58319.1 FAM63A-like isoform X2 [Chlorella sorokiniana]
MEWPAMLGAALLLGLLLCYPLAMLACRNKVPLRLPYRKQRRRGLSPAHQVSISPQAALTAALLPQHEGPCQLPTLLNLLHQQWQQLGLGARTLRDSELAVLARRAGFSSGLQPGQPPMSAAALQRFAAWLAPQLAVLRAMGPGVYACQTAQLVCGFDIDRGEAEAALAAHDPGTFCLRLSSMPGHLVDVNGPCPLLAIANVLLLRNQIQLPAGVGEVSQSRLVEMVAGYLLDANSLEGERNTALSEEQRASLAHNLSDAIALLPKLTTGIDVNVRFHDIAGFEYTPETAVFDLLDMPLVHGWLVDPQDAPTAAAVGHKTYNELVVQLVNALAREATPRQLTPSGSLTGKQLSPRAAAAVAAAQQAQPQQAQPQQQSPGQAAGQLSAEQLSAALRQTLQVSVPAQREVDSLSSGPPSAKSAGGGMGGGEASRAASVASMPTSASMQSFVNRMLTDLVADAFTSQAVTPSYTSHGTGALPDVSTSEALRSSSNAEDGDEATSALRAAMSAGGSTGEPLAIATLPAEQPDEVAAGGAAEAGTAAAIAAGAGAGAAAASGAASGGGSNATSPGEAAVREALLVQQFLDGHPSQLTFHGLVALQEGLRPNQLAVFFRNNHFSTLFKHEGQLYALVTDEGFQYETDVVWEHICDVSNDTQLVDGQFRPFVPHASHDAARERQAAAHDAQWAAAAATGEHTHDSDLALAMQLQAEEEERVRQEEQRRAAAAARQQEEQRRQAAQRAAAAQQVLPSQRRQSGSPGGGKKKKDKSDSSCSIM